MELSDGTWKDSFLRLKKEIRGTLRIPFLWSEVMTNARFEYVGKLVDELGQL